MSLASVMLFSFTSIFGFKSICMLHTLMKSGTLQQVLRLPKQSEDRGKLLQNNSSAAQFLILSHLAIKVYLKNWLPLQSRGSRK